MTSLGRLYCLLSSIAALRTSGREVVTAHVRFGLRGSGGRAVILARAGWCSDDSTLHVAVCIHTTGNGCCVAAERQQCCRRTPTGCRNLIAWLHALALRRWLLSPPPSVAVGFAAYHGICTPGHPEQAFAAVAFGRASPGEALWSGRRCSWALVVQGAQLCLSFFA